MENKNLIIGAAVVVGGLFLAKRAVKKGKNVPVIGGFFKKPKTESKEVSSEEAVTEEAVLEETGANFSNAAGMPKGYSTDCFRSSQGDTCCYNKSKTSIQCDGVYTSGAEARMTPLDKLIRSGRKSYSSRPERPSARRVRRA